MHAQHNFSPLIAGTMTWGIWGRNFNQQEMIEMMNHYVEAGISSFDHADIYGDYTTEAAFGSAFAKSEISRNAVQFISKCGIQTLGGLRNNKVKHYNYRKKYIIESVEQSLKNLHTDYLDLLLLHRPSPLMQPEEIASAIHQLKSEGKLLNFGLSNFTAAQTDFIEQAVHVHSNQIKFSITHFTPMLDGSLNHMQMKGIMPMCWAPLGHVF
jgi:predicted oxidoreductase